MATVDLPAGTISYRVAGPATAAVPPVVFVHGAARQRRTVGRRRLRPGRTRCPFIRAGLAARLAHDAAEAGRRPDAAGHRPDHPAFIAALGLDDVTLVGNDTGGALCQFVIDTDPAPIGRLVLTNCDAFDRFPPPPFGQLFKAGSTPAGLRALIAPLRAKAVRHSPAGYGLLVDKPLDERLTRRWVEPCLGSGPIRRDTAALFKAVDKNELLDISTRLADFDKPVLLVWGAADRMFKLDFARRLADAFPDARLVEVDGGKTFVPLDEPERVASEIASAFYPATSGAAGPT